MKEGGGEEGERERERAGEVRLYCGPLCFALCNFDFFLETKNYIGARVE